MLNALRARWGERIIGADGADRAAIAEIVFADPDELAWLEALLHPKVLREYQTWRDRVTAAPAPPRVTVAEIPLLYETGAEGRFDVVVAITAPPELRRERARVPVEPRERRLIPDEEKLRRADFAYVNDGTLEELDAFAADVIARLS